MIVSGSDDNTIRLWDVNNDNNMECIKILEGHTSWITSIAVLPNGMIVSGSWDKTIRVWDVNNDNNVEYVNLVNKDGYQFPIEVSFDDELLIFFKSFHFYEDIKTWLVTNKGYFAGTSTGNVYYFNKLDCE
jgi:WD40 repeat protein